MVIALGANLPGQDGGPANSLKRAIVLMAAAGLEMRAVSRFYETPCFPADAGPDYVNAVVMMRSASAPREVLELLHRIEAGMGRTRETRWGMRTLDLDLIAVGDMVLPDRATHATWRDLPAAEQRLRAPEELILPHPRLAERAFVLVPLSDIAPDWVHPVTGLSVIQMRDALPQADLKAVKPL
jgi:2-amino-4-hydroxy-6-hydroxymethyldihydropteridine diphosphokinase